MKLMDTSPPQFQSLVEHILAEIKSKPEFSDSSSGFLSEFLRALLRQAATNGLVANGQMETEKDITQAINFIAALPAQSVCAQGLKNDSENTVSSAQTMCRQNPDLRLKSMTDRRHSGVDEWILHLYSRGVGNNEIKDLVNNATGGDLSLEAIESSINIHFETANHWNQRRLSPVYPIVFFETIPIKIMQGNTVENCFAMLAIGVSLTGDKEYLGVWKLPELSAEQYAGALNDLLKRGINDVLIFCGEDSNSQLSKIGQIFPNAMVEQSIAHMLQYSNVVVGWRLRKSLTDDIRRIYKSQTVLDAQVQLALMTTKWEREFPDLIAHWKTHWGKVERYFSYAPELRRVLNAYYTFESIGTRFRAVNKLHGYFKNHQEMVLVFFTHIKHLQARRSNKIHNWQPALRQLMERFPGRLEPILRSVS